MARPILSEFGPDASKPQAARATCGGVTMSGKRDVMNYKPPQGPTSIGNQRVGLGGEVYKMGSQGPSASSPSEGGGAGLHGEAIKPGGSQRG
jgi:hypothetical protein